MQGHLLAVGSEGNVVADHLDHLCHGAAYQAGRGWRGRRAALLCIVGFLAVLFTFFGVNFLLKSVHSF